ncbi:MAG TPA: hypothetical protein VGJ37_13295 [Pyrinomonadaceae bacterium]|jgi:esterase/lipase
MKEETLKGSGEVTIFLRSWQPATDAGSQFFYDTAGSEDKTLKLYEGHFHDLLNDVGKEIVMKDINDWIDARLSARETVKATTTAA